MLGWHLETLQQPLPVHPQGNGAVLQQGTLSTLLGTSDYFFAGDTQLVARQGSKTGRGSRGTRRHGPSLGTRQMHRETEGLQRCRQCHADTTIVLCDRGWAISKSDRHHHTIRHFLVV